ncbi:MAG: peptidase S10 [Pseudomonadota bacterium]|jgi:carboxypeptidase C (cathepsin A)|nr:peptidase S10 [Pseudomonadota bacterium]MDE3141075.1 peptidase S10 [Pseudomonadota bacterium]
MSARRLALAVAIAAALLPISAFAAKPEAKPGAHATNIDHYWATPHTSATTGEVTINGKHIDYTADTGTIILHDKQGKPTGEMFYVAYIKRGVDAAKRPISFLYNGGPGSSSVWLHMGAFGPVRVVTQSHIHTPPAPYRLVNNDYSLLNASDLVFVDAMGTGYSRILGKAEGGVGTPKMFYGVDPDGQAFAQFISNFLSQYGRWNSPKYLIGESYGTTRNAVLANILEQQDNIDLNGVVMMSSILNFDTSIDQPNLNPGINLPYALALPSYAAIAWYHKALANPPATLHPWLDQVQTWAMGPYLQALNEGAALPVVQEDAIARQMATYTGLPERYVLRADLRVTGPEFEQTLLLPRGETTGRLDARFSGPTMDPLAESAMYDPQSAAISSAYTAAFNDYVRKTLKFGGKHTYKIVSNTVGNDWNLLHTPPGQTSPAYIATNVMPDLAAAMSYNPDLKVMVNAGYYDLATPYYAAWYQFEQLPMQRKLMHNIQFHYYHVGHMLYVRPQDLVKVHANIVKFIRSTDHEPATR